MGELVCTKCKAKSTSDTFEEADELIDHAKGVLRGKPCNANPLDLLWNDKPVATVVFHFGPGSKDHEEHVKKSQEKLAEKAKADAEAQKKTDAEKAEAKKKADKEAKEKAEKEKKDQNNSPKDSKETSTTN